MKTIKILLAIAIATWLVLMIWMVGASQGRQAAVEALEQLGAQVQHDGFYGYSVSMREEITEQFVDEVANIGQLRVLDIRRTPISDDHLRRLQGVVLRDIAILYQTGISDSGLKYLNGLRHFANLPLERLYLGATRITDAGLKTIATWPPLSHLYIGGTQISDDGLKHLASTAIATLDIHDCDLTDNAIVHLARISELHSIWIWGTQIDQAKLAAALPNCQLVTEDPTMDFQQNQKR